MNSFIGISEQQVPLYSAVKVKGKKMYQYARSNIKIEPPKRKIEIYSIELLDDIKSGNGKLKFKIKCHVSKGTYIRSLIRDIGLKLGYPACMSSLRRIKQGNFLIENCHTIEDIANNNYKVLTIDEVLSNIESISVTKDEEKKIRNGAIIEKSFDSDMVKVFNQDGVLLAIYKTYNKDIFKAKPYKMLITKDN